MTTISQTAGRANGFKNWSVVHPPASADADNDHAAVGSQTADEPVMAPAEQPHRPWLVPGRDTL
jgi:hypothetical protein